MIVRADWHQEKLFINVYVLIIFQYLQQQFALRFIQFIG